MAKKAERTAQFLITEYTSISERIGRIEQIISTRVNFFLVTVGAIAAGITAAKDTMCDGLHNIILLSSIVLVLWDYQRFIFARTIL